jgi:hypothetical protein
MTNPEVAMGNSHLQVDITVRTPGLWQDFFVIGFGRTA